MDPSKSFNLTALYLDHLAKSPEHEQFVKDLDQVILEKLLKD